MASSVEIKIFFLFANADGNVFFHIFFSTLYPFLSYSVFTMLTRKFTDLSKTQSQTFIVNLTLLKLFRTCLKHKTVTR